MRIKCKSLKKTRVRSAISLVITNRLSKRRGINLDELKKCSLAGGSRKQEK